jgi:hypothetical protein
MFFILYAKNQNSNNANAFGNVNRNSHGIHCSKAFWDATNNAGARTHATAIEIDPKNNHILRFESKNDSFETDSFLLKIKILSKAKTKNPINNINPVSILDTNKI